MSSPALGRLVRADLRTAWTSEPAHFTPWLAQQENLQLLGEIIASSSNWNLRRSPSARSQPTFYVKTQQQVIGCSSRTSSNVPTTRTSAS